MYRSSEFECNVIIKDKMVCTVSLYLTLTGELANAVLAFLWIASCISDPGPWANIHLHLSGVKFPSSTSLRSTSPALSHHLKSYSSATHCSNMCQEFVSPLVCQLSIHTVTHPYDMWPDVTPSFHPSSSADQDVIP